MELQRPPSRQPLPPHATRVFEGELFDVYQWEQEQFDGSVKTFEKLKRDDTVVIVPTIPGKRFLFLTDEQPGRDPILTFPAGRIEDPNESPLDGAKRELREETGYESNGWTLWKAYQPITKIDWALYIFIARNCVKVGGPELDAGERIHVQEVDLDHVIGLLNDPRFVSDDIREELTAAKYNQEQRTLLEKTLFG